MIGDSLVHLLRWLAGTDMRRYSCAECREVIVLHPALICRDCLSRLGMWHPEWTPKGLNHEQDAGNERRNA